MSVELLLRRGASVATCDRRGNSPLQLASLQRVPGVVRLLLDAKADSLARNQDGMPAAHIAAFTDSQEPRLPNIAPIEQTADPLGKRPRTPCPAHTYWRSEGGA